MAKTSIYPIPNWDADWSDNPVDHLPQSGSQVKTFLTGQFKSRFGAAYFDQQNFMLYFFVDDAAKQEWIADPTKTELVISSTPFNFSMEQFRIRTVNNNPSATLNATTNMEDLVLSLDFYVETKQISDISWTQTGQGCFFKVFIDRGVTGSYEQIGQSFVTAEDGTWEFDIRDFLAVGGNRVKIEMTAEENEQVTGVFMYSVTLAEMYVEEFNNSWYQAIVEAGNENHYKLGGFRIVGSINKSLHMDFYTGNELVKSFTKVIGVSSYIDSPYNFTRDEGLNLEDLETGVYNVHVYLTSGSLSTKDNSIKYNVMYVASGDEYTAELTVMNNAAAMVYNYDEAAFLCDYSCYNKGLSSATPHVKVTTYISTTPSSTEEFDNLVDTDTSIGLYSPIQMATEVQTNLRVDFEISLGETGIQRGTAVVDNSVIFPAESGATFFLNTNMRSNGETNRTNVINYATNPSTTINTAEWTKMSWADDLDGWTTDEDGRKCLRVMAGSKMVLPAIDGFKILQGDNMTFEICYKVKNVSDYNENCITVASNPTQAGFHGIRIKPTNICVHSSEDVTAANDTNRGVNVGDEQTIHLLVTIQNSFGANPGKNLVTGYVNGCKNFQFYYNNGAIWADNYADLIIGSQTADVYVYYVRVYNHNALGIMSAEKNFINSLQSRDDKLAVKALIDSCINESTHEITYEAVRDSSMNYNYFVVEMLDGATIPSKKNGWEKEGKAYANLEMHFGEHPLWDFKIYGVRTEGQGTTSMNYYLWNLRWRIDKTNSTKKLPIAYYNTPTIRPDGTKEYSEQSAVESKTVFFDGGAPGTTQQHPAVKRMTAKINFASSMQSHKIGATRAYNDLHDKLYDGAMLNEAQLAAQEAGTPMPTVAVYEYPAFGFSKTTDSRGIVSYEFIGLFTIGPDKGDKPTFGFDTVEDSLITLEGTDHTPRMAKFNTPWDSTHADLHITYDSDNAVDSAFISLKKEGGTWDDAWEVGDVNGLDLDDPLAKEALLAEFKPAYDVAYNNSTLIFPIALNDPDWGGANAAAVLANINADLTTFRLTQYNSRFTYADMEFWIEGEHILYHYDLLTGQYIAGANLGTATGTTLEEQNEAYKAARREQFKADVADYWDMNETIFHMVFLLIFGATDNFAKNSYPYKMAALEDGGRWRWRQDDLDTIFDIDNNGGQTKPYYIEFTDAEGGSPYFAGSASVFWNLVFECFWDDVDDQQGIRSMGRAVMSMMETLGGGANTYAGCLNFFKKYFWDNAQNYFPISAYNTDGNIKYERAWLSGSSFSVPPLTQSLGNHLSAEQFWADKRTIYCMSLFKLGPFVNYANSIFGSIQFRPVALGSMSVKPNMWLYPSLIIGAEDVRATARTEEGETHTFSGLEGDGQTVFTLQATDLLAEIGDLKDLVRGNMDTGPLEIQGKKLRTFKIGAADGETVTTNVTGLSFLNCVCLETINAKGAESITGSLDLMQCKRLRELILDGTNISTVSLPKGSKVETLTLPDAITNISLLGVKFLEELALPANPGQIQTLRLEDTDALESLQTLYSIFNADDSDLTYIRLILGAGEKLMPDAGYMFMLGCIADNVKKDGTEHIYEGLNSQGSPEAGLRPVIEGTVKLTTPHYPADFEKLQLTNIEDYGEGLKIGFTNLFGPLNVIFKDENYFPMADAAVTLALAQSIGDGYGVTESQVLALTTLGQRLRNNKSIRTFDEFENFTNVTRIESFEYDGCSSLVSVTIPQSVRTIGSNVFRSSNAVIDTLRLPLLTEISEMPVQHCINLGQITTIPRHVAGTPLKDIVIPPTVVTIANYAFETSRALSVVTCRPTTPPTFNGDFRSTVSHIFVPASSLDDYKTASGWSSSASIMKGFFEASELPADNTDGDYCFVTTEDKLYGWSGTDWEQIV